MKKKPTLFDYNTFRTYLPDWYYYAHATAPKKHPKAKICCHLGLPNSRSYFTDVLNGKFVSQSFSSDVRQPRRKAYFLN